MLNKINGSIGFGSKFIRNEAMDEGIKYAKNATDGDYIYESNCFANAVNKLLNDGKNDVYEVVGPRGNNSQYGKYHLLKDGWIVAESTCDSSVGQCVVGLINDYARRMFSPNALTKPLTESMKLKANIADLRTSLETDANNFLEKANKRLDVTESYVNAIVAQEVKDKIDNIKFTKRI